MEAVGYGVTIVKPGDEVLGMLPYPYSADADAEYVTGPAVAPKRTSISHGLVGGSLPYFYFRTDL